MLTVWCQIIRPQLDVLLVKIAAVPLAIIFLKACSGNLNFLEYLCMLSQTEILQDQGTNKYLWLAIAYIINSWQALFKGIKNLNGINKAKVYILMYNYFTSRDDKEPAGGSVQGHQDPARGSML